MMPLRMSHNPRPPLSDAEFGRRAKNLRWLLCDVDGVLTDGRLLYGPQGEELKSFDVKDGLGLKLAQRAGLKVGLLSSRNSPALAQRAVELGIDAMVTGHEDKGAAFEGFLAAQEISADEVAYIGDDLPDLPVLRRCGLAFAPADAVPEVQAAVDQILPRPGGRGAVREMVERILKARGEWARGMD